MAEAGRAWCRRQLGIAPLQAGCIIVVGDSDRRCVRPNARRSVGERSVRVERRERSTDGIARELEISKNTVRKYLAAEGTGLTGAGVRSNPSLPVTIDNVTNGHNH